MAPDDTALPAADASLVRHPTRRRLLELLAAAHPVSAAANPVEAGATAAEPDPVLVLFMAFRQLLAEHEAALWRCDRREAWLQAEVDYPRVQLPRSRGLPVRYAADAETIAQHVPPGRRRYRLRQVLLRRQVAWARGARICGLTQAQEQEVALDQAVRAAAATLTATPTSTASGIRAKLVTLLAMHEPGPAFRDTEPWWELRPVLADLGRLAAE